MQNTVTDTCGSHTIKIVLFIVVIILLLWSLYSYYNSNNTPEKFINQKIISKDPLILQQKETVPVFSPVVDNKIQAAIEFIPKNDYFTQWGSMGQADITLNQGSGTEGIEKYTLGQNQCSAACCTNQWPVPFELPEMLCAGNKSEFVPSGYYCNDGINNSGCLCMKKDQANFLQSHGLNN